METMSLEDMERIHIGKVLSETDSLDEAASTLGIAPSTLWRKRKKYGL
jgi:NtrC-family two-component system response regulator AlgB